MTTLNGNTNIDAQTMIANAALLAEQAMAELDQTVSENPAIAADEAKIAAMTAELAQLREENAKIQAANAAKTAPKPAAPKPATVPQVAENKPATVVAWPTKSDDPRWTPCPFAGQYPVAATPQDKFLLDLVWKHRATKLRAAAKSGEVAGSRGDAMFWELYQLMVPGFLAMNTAQRDIAKANVQKALKPHFDGAIQRGMISHVAGAGTMLYFDGREVPQQNRQNRSTIQPNAKAAALFGL